MTQDEAKECAWEAWLACAQFNRVTTGAEGSADIERVHFARWWRRSKHMLPGFRR